MRLVLERDDGRNPISGVLRDEAGNQLAFSGWLGLAVALEALGFKHIDDSESEA